MATFTKDLSAASGNTFIRQGVQDDTTAKLIEAGASFGLEAFKGKQRANLSGELEGSEALSQQEQSSILNKKFDNPFEDANAAAIADFQNELGRVNALGASKGQADARSRAIIKKFKSRVPGLSADFDKIAAGVTATGATASAITSAAEQQEMVVKKQIESLKTLATQNNLVFSTNPKTLSALYSALELKRKAEAGETTLKLKKQQGESLELDQREFMPTSVAAIADGLSGFLGSSLGVESVTDDGFLDSLGQNEELRRSSLLSMDLAYNKIKSQLRQNYNQLPIGEYDANLKVLETQYELVKGVVSGEREKSDLTSFTELMDARNKEEIAKDPELSLLLTVVRQAPGVANDLKVQEKIRTGSLNLLKRMTTSSNGESLAPTGSNPEQAERAKNDNTAAMKVTATIAKQYAALEDVDSEVGKSFEFVVSRVLTQLSNDETVTASAYNGLFEAAARDPKSWRKIVNEINPAQLPQFDKAAELFIGGKLLPSLNKAAAALKNRPFFGESDAEMVSFKITNNVLAFQPTNPRDQSHIKKANEFNNKYGKPFNTAIKAVSSVVGTDAAQAKLEEFKFNVDLRNAEMEGEKSGLLSVSSRKSFNRNKADFTINKFKTSEGTLEQMLEKEKENPTLLEFDSWDELKQEAIESGRIGNVPDVQKLFESIRKPEEQPKAESVKDDQASLADPFEQINEILADVPAEERAEFLMSRLKA